MNGLKIFLIGFVVIFVNNGFAHEEIYTNCQRVGDTEITSNDTCKMNVSGCLQNGQPISTTTDGRPVEGLILHAECDAVPQTTRDLPSRAGCPSANECANDPGIDGKRDYHGDITWIVTASHRDFNVGDIWAVDSPLRITEHPNPPVPKKGIK